MTSIFICNTGDAEIIEMLSARRGILLALLPATITRKLQNLRKDSDFCEQLVGKLLLMHGLEKFGKETDLKKLQYTAYHRPFLDTVFDFNISHTQNCVACIISSDGCVGIDIEEINDIELADYAMFFTPDELAALATDERGIIGSFYNLWTKKESVLKANGKGLIYPLKDVKILEGDLYSYCIIDEKKWYIYDLEKLKPEYSGHFSTDFEISAVYVEYVTASSLFKLSCKT